MPSTGAGHRANGREMPRASGVIPRWAWCLLSVLLGSGLAVIPLCWGEQKWGAKKRGYSGVPKKVLRRRLQSEAHQEELCPKWDQEGVKVKSSVAKSAVSHTSAPDGTLKLPELGAQFQTALSFPPFPMPETLSSLPG